MIPETTKLKLQEILSRIANDEKVTLEERFILNDYADKDQKIASWLTKARRIQQRQNLNDPIDALLDGLDIGSSEPETYFRSEDDDLGEWFSGAPNWLGRS